MDGEAQTIVNQIKEHSDYFQKAKLIQYLNTQKQVSIKNISQALALKPSYVCHILRLNKVADIIIDGYYANLVSLSHLFVLSRLKTQEEMLEVYERILSDNLTVLQTEYVVRERLHHVDSKGTRLAKEDLEAFAAKIAAGYENVSVKMLQTRIRGKLVIEVKGNVSKTTEFLQSLLARFQDKKE